MRTLEKISKIDNNTGTTSVYFYKNTYAYIEKDESGQSTEITYTSPMKRVTKALDGIIVNAYIYHSKKHKENMANIGYISFANGFNICTCNLNCVDDCVIEAVADMKKENAVEIIKEIARNNEEFSPCGVKAAQQILKNTTSPKPSLLNKITDKLFELCR